MNTLAIESSTRKFWTFACIYGFVSNFFIANFYSLGLHRSTFILAFVLVGLAPVFGSLSFYLNAWSLRITGRLFSGTASVDQLVGAIVRSKFPYLFSMIMWVFLAIANPGMVFIHYASSSSAVLIILLSTAVNFASFVILVRSIRILQSFSLLKACFNAILALLLTCFVSLLVMFVSRFIYISYF